ncbi:MAG: ribosome silencing factor [Bacteroidales bacterium]
MNETKELVKKIIEGIQEKKGNKITVVDLTKIQDAICHYFVVCQGGSSTHVGAIADSVVDYVKKNLGDKPLAQDGRTNMEWVAIDHGSVMTHVFMPESREYYRLEQLWNDARLTHIEDIY